MTARIRVLGIDPGYRLTGYGLIDTDGQQSRHVASGNIQTVSSDPATRLKSIYFEVRRIVDEYHPDEVAVEKVFMHRNADSALKLGQARAAAICATFGTEVVIYEYAARLVKQSVVGRAAPTRFRFSTWSRHFSQLTPRWELTNRMPWPWPCAMRIRDRWPGVLNKAA